MGSLAHPSPPNHKMDDRRPESPRQARRDRDDRTVLPPISQLLPDIGHARPRSGASNHSPTMQYPPLSTSRGSSDQSPSYRYQGPPAHASHRSASPGRHYQDRYPHDRYDLPHHSGPPSDRPYPSMSHDQYPRGAPSANTSSSSPYAAQSSSYSGTPYSTPGSDRRREDDRGTLPPPPLSHSYGGAPPGPPQYPDSRGHPPDGRYDSYHASSSSGHPYPHPDASRPYDPRMGPSDQGSAGPYPQHPHHPYPPMPPHSAGQYSSMDEPARKRRGNLPRWMTDVFKAWFLEHIAHPYPSEQEKNELCMQTGCTMTQISNWFINARRRQTPLLTRQAEAERRLRDGATGRSSSNSE